MGIVDRIPAPGAGRRATAWQRLKERDAEQQIQYPYGSAEQKQWSSRAWELLAENLWNIGVTQGAPLALVYRSNLMNVPLKVPPNSEGDIQYNNYADQIFFKN